MLFHPDGTCGLERALRQSDDMVEAVLNGPDMLEPDQIAERLGVSRDTVKRKRHRGEVLGVGGAERGFRYPKWQIDNAGVAAIQGMDRVIAACRGDHWRAYRVLTRSHAELDGKTGLDAMKNGQVNDILGVIENMERGQFA